MNSAGEAQREKDRPSGTSDLKARTIQDFGDQWTTYRDNPGYYASTELLADLFGPLLQVGELDGLRAADIGSGTGRIVNMLLAAGVAHVHAVEPSAAMSVLQDNTRAHRTQVTYVHGPGETLPAGLGLDLIVSIGVLHHIPNPAPVVQAAYQALRPGGRMLVWLYGQEGNETYLRFSEPVRRVTTKLPHAMLAVLSSILCLALDAYIAICRFIPLPMRHYMRDVLHKFPRSVRRLTIYDQLNPAYAKYYTRHQAVNLLAENGFSDVALFHRHGYSWSALGRKASV